MAGKKKLIDKIIRWLWYLVASTILVSAVIISLVRFALTEVDSYQETIEQLASKAVKHQVYIESLDARLVGMTPTLVLEGVHVLDEDGNNEILRVNKANIGISILQSIKHRKVIPKDILISGTKIGLIRLPNGQVRLQGFDFATENNTKDKGDQGLTTWFFTQSSLEIKKSTIVWKDYKRKQKPIRLSNINLELLNRGSKHQLVGSFSPSSKLGKKFEVAMDIDGDLQNPSEWRGEFFIQGDEIFLARWGERARLNKIEITDGVVDFQLWGSINKQGANQLHGDISAYQVKIIDEANNKQLDIGLLGGLFELAYDKQNWHLNVDRFQYTGTGGILPETNFSIISTQAGKDSKPQLDVRIGQLDLQGVSEVATNSGLLSKEHENLLKGLAPSGNVSALRITSLPQQQGFLAHAQLKNISTQFYNDIPGIKNLSGDIWLDQSSGKLKLNTQSGGIDFGELFRAPIKLDKAKGEINWWKFESGWQVSTTELLAENNEINTLNNFSLFIPENGSIHMELHSAFAGNAEYKSNYLPVAIMNKPLVNWLDRSLVSGVISHGGVVYRGRFSDFPYRDPTGQFLVQLYTDNLVLNYQDGWPAIHNAEFDARFDSKSINIDLHLARLFSSAITDTTIAISDYREPVVDVKGQATGGMADVVKFVVSSPLNVSKELLDIRYGGRAKTSIDLHIPLEEGRTTGYSGTVSLDKGEIQLLGDTIKLTNIKGDLAFANRGFTSDNLTADFFGKTSAINIYSQKTTTGDKTYLATSGQTDATQLLKSFAVPAYKHSKGSIEWQALLDFSDDKKKVPVLSVRSDLVGLGLDMPYPLNKNPEAKKDFSLQAYFKGDGHSDLYLKYGKYISLAGHLIKKKSKTVLERAHVRFTRGDASLPKQKVLYLSGNLGRFYPARWVRHLDSYQELKSSGTLDIPIVLNMNRLSVELDKSTSDKDASIKPTEFPIISGTVKNLKFDGMPLGKLNLDMIHHKGDMKLNKLNIHSADMDFYSSGRWSYNNKKNDSKLNVSLKSKNMGKLFKRLGFAAIIDNGESDIKGSLHWPGTPFAFALKRLNGKLKIYVKDGSIADVDPGAGRMVGLLSLSELPRRLMLDFSDMFKKGLVFDEIKGNVTLNNGTAITKGINVESSVADVKIQGSTSLVKRDYNQIVHVVPKVGETLPVASGVLFGSQIGALVLLFEKMMGKEIEKAAERKYKVTGSWDEPVIERLDKPVEPVEEEDEE